MNRQDCLALGPLKVCGHINEVDKYQEVRATIDNGGPQGMEVVFSCYKGGTKVTVYNPFTKSWNTVFDNTK